MNKDPLKDIQYSNVIFDSAPIGMGIAEFDGTLLKVNPAFCETIGYPEKELIGKKFMSFTHPDDLEVNLKQNRRITTGEIARHSLVKRYIHKSGKIIHAIMTVTSLVNREGEINYLLAQVVDITERKEIEDAYAKSEKEFRDIFENAPISIAKVGMDGKIINVNRAFTENFGYSFTDLRNLTLSDISHPDDLKENLEMDKQLLAGKLEDFTMEKRYIHKNGEIIHGLLKVSLIRDENESYFLGQIVDITRIKQTEKELEDKNLSLNKINQELDQFVYRSSHDLKGPITTIKGLLQLAEKEKKKLPYEEQMTKSLFKLENVINDIVNYSQNAHFDLSYCKINMGEFLREILQEQKEVFPEKKVTIETEMEISSPIITDKNRLYIVLQNVLNNAIRYEDPEKDGCHIDIRILAGTEICTITINDNGKGIPGEELPKIFNMFYRADETSEGSGLGLYIVREALHKLGGDLSILSELKKGTTVTITMPNRITRVNCDE